MNLKPTVRKHCEVYACAEFKIDAQKARELVGRLVTNFKLLESRWEEPIDNFPPALIELLHVKLSHLLEQAT